MKKIFGVLVGVIISFACDAGSLCLICIGNRPYESEVYESGNGAGVYVVQVLENGVLASVRPGSLGCVAPNFIFVEMSTAGIVDGESLPWDGMYKLNGTYHYISTVGSEKTVYKFRECTKKERADHLDYLKREKERQQKYDEEQKRLQEEKHMEAVRSKVISKVTDMVKNCSVDFDKMLNDENGLLKDPKFSKERALWQRLRDSKEAGNVIDFLNVVEAIVCECDEVGDTFNKEKIDKDDDIDAKSEYSGRRRRRQEKFADNNNGYVGSARLMLNYLTERISSLEIEAIDGELEALKKDKEGYEESFTKLGIANGSYHSGVFDLFGKARRDVGIATIYKRYISHAISEIVIPDEKSVMRKSKGVAMSKEEYFRTDSKVIATADQYKIVSNRNSSYYNPELAKRLKKRMNEAYNSYVAEVVNDKLNQESMNLYAEMHDAVISVIDKKVEKLTSESWKLRCN